MNELKSLVFKLREYLNEGGAGSGNFGHAGRPGEVGGSATDGEGGPPSGAGSVDKALELDYMRNQGRIKISKVKSVKSDGLSAWKFTKLFANVQKDYMGYENRKHAEFLHANYEEETVRSGFAGSGTWIYTDKKTGEKFEVEGSPNGKGFYGIDYFVSKIK